VEQPKLTIAVLQHAENLRLKKSDFEVLGRVGEGQFGVVSVMNFSVADNRSMPCGLNSMERCTP
jgi:hypothetical protein